MVAVGLTSCEPLAATAPMPLSIETDVAFVVVHVRVLDWPWGMVVGLAENVMVGWAAWTVRVVDPLTEPEATMIVVEPVATLLARP